MSTTLLGEIWTLPIKTTEKLLLAYLADSADHQGNLPAVTVKDLAEIADRSTKTIRGALESLEQAGYLDRPDERWAITPYPRVSSPAEPAEPDDLHDQPDTTKSEESDDEQVPGPTQNAETPVGYPTDRLAHFCEAWGLSIPEPHLPEAWAELEEREGKHDHKEKHRDPETGRAWTVTAEAMDEQMPAILHAVKVYRHRAQQGLPNHAATAAEFVSKELWLAPEYQVPIEQVGQEDRIDESELDALVMEMNRFGGNFRCHLRQTSKNPDTGEFETETLEIYDRRVRAKYREFQEKRDYFTE